MVNLRVILVVICLTFPWLTLQGQPKNADTARIITFRRNIPQLKRERAIRVYLPAGYTSAKKRYPVIYMHDGQNLFGDIKAPFGNWYIDSAMRTMPADKQAIIVGIYNGDKFRINEYSPYDSQYGKAQGAAYLEFIVNTLKPHIDSVYRTKPDVKHTAIIGSSMGGLISMYAALKYPDVFGTAGVLSPSFWLSPQIYTDAAAATNRKTRFFLACGDKEGSETSYVHKMDTLLLRHGFSRKNLPEPVIVKDGKHNEAQWRQVFVQFYAWLMR